MKINWGTGIFAFIIFFFVLVITFLIFTFRQEFNLVEDDYYAKELRYGDQINKISNTAGLAEKVKVELKKEGILVTFPQVTSGKNISGNILVYRPSDKKWDIKVPVKPDTNNQLFILNKNMVRGRYILKIDWKMDSISYYQEEPVYLP